MELKIAINQEEEFTVTLKNDKVLLNGEDTTYEIRKITDDRFFFYRSQKVYDIKVISHNRNLLTVNINGELLELTIKDHIAQILERLGMETEVSESVESIHAPMPGGILEVAVNAGEEVMKGDKLIILEAMKMENVIKSPADGIISAVHVKPGDNVEKNQKLLSF